MGYYDSACPMGQNDQLLDRLQLDERIKGNIVRTRYQSGHMIYLDDGCRRQLHADVAKFIRSQSHPAVRSTVLKRP
jgi:carboxypeptidase C (cathepsin A)